MARKGKRFWLKFGVIVLILAGLAAFNYWPVHEKIIISPQTTVIDGPVNPDGTINYVACLDAKYAEGVTPENNAAPLLIKAFGPDFLKDTARAQVLSRLGLSESDMNNGKHFVQWKDRAFKTPTTKPMHGGHTDDRDLANICDDLADGTIKGDPELEAWLADNTEALGVVCAASLRPRYWVPFAGSGNPAQLVVSSFYPNLTVFREGVDALCARAIIRAHAGDADGCWSDLIAAHRLARLQGQGPFLLSQLVAVSLDFRASRAGTYAISKGAFAAMKLPVVLDDLSALSAMADIVDSIDRGERFMGLDIIMTVSRAGGDDIVDGAKAYASGADWNAVLRNANEYYDDMVNALRTPRFGDHTVANAFAAKMDAFEKRTGASKLRGIKMIAERLGGRITRRALTNDVSDLLASLYMPSLNRVVVLHDDNLMRFEVERTAAALALYKARHGRFPASLNDLCPELLKEVTKDVFSPKGELVYRANDNAYIVYSVGRNLKDDGGVGDNTGKDDIVAKVGDVDSRTTLPASRPGL